MNDELIRYPIGRFDDTRHLSSDDTQAAIERLGAFPELLKQLATHVPTAHWDKPYRPGGWTLRQVIHHLADSHMNAYVRTRLALTEDNPTIKPYKEALWANLPDALNSPVDPSLLIIRQVHARWVDLLQRLRDADFERKWTHPDQGKTYTLRQLVAMYAHHGTHHYHHVRNYLVAKGIVK